MEAQKRGNYRGGNLQAYLISLFPLMTRFYGLDPDYQRQMLARTWLLYSRSIAPVSALEQAWELGVAHSSEPQKLMRSLRRAATPFMGGKPDSKAAPGKRRRDSGEAPVLRQIAPWMSNPQLRKFITIRKAPEK